MPAEAAAAGGTPGLNPPELPWGGQDPTSRPVLQISPSTLPPAAARPLPDGPGDASTAPTVAPTGAAVNHTDSAESEGNGSTLEESQETTTSTIITTTVITTEPTPGKLHGEAVPRGLGGVQQWWGTALPMGSWGHLEPSALWQHGFPQKLPCRSAWAPPVTSFFSLAMVFH